MVPDHIRREFKASLQRVRDGFILAFIATVISLPQLRYQAGSFYQRIFHQPPDAVNLDKFFLAQVIITLSALMIIVLVGDLANRRVGFKPFAWPGHRHIWPVLGLGILFIPLVYFLYDHYIIALLPETYPKKLGYAILYPFSASFPDEIFVRYGFLGLFAWILHRVKGGKFFANFFVAAVFSLFAWYNVARYIEVPVKAVEIAFLLVGAFLENFIAGWLYFKYGFWSALAFRFGVDLKYPLYFFLFF